MLSPKIGCERKIWIIAFLFVLVFLVGITPAMAQGEYRDEPGVEGDKPLKFLSITLKGSGTNVNGASGIPTNPEFKLEFSKNVVNMLIWENNRQCFSLSAKGGGGIPLTVTKIDDTVDASQRHYIFIKPKQALQTGTTYILKISPQLKAKNGNTLGETTGGKGITISFKTEGEAPLPAKADSSQKPKEQKSDIKVSTPKPEEGKNQAVQPDDTSERSEDEEKNSGAGDVTEELNEQDTAETAAPTQNDNNDDATEDQQTSAENRLSGGTIIGIIVVVLILGWVLIEFWWKRKKGV